MILGLLARIRPNRRIDAITAVFLPFTPSGEPDLAGFQRHLRRTMEAGLQPAVNMDTGFGPQLTPEQRRIVLQVSREVLGPGLPFVAGAAPFGEDGDPLAAYRRGVANIVRLGGTPIVFQSELFRGREGAALTGLYRDILAEAPAGLAFELGPQFAPFGRIYALEDFRRLLELPVLRGLKHSSLERGQELDRLAARDQARPDFKVYTGNDLAIDLVMYGSDYLLGLSTFDPHAFAVRDRWWAEGDARFFALNDALQALGAVAFREPVPAYKDSAAAYLRLTGALPGALPHPVCPRRPADEEALLAPFARRIAAAVSAPPGGA